MRRVLILAAEADLAVTHLLRRHLDPLVEEDIVDRVSWCPEPEGDESSFEALARMARSARMVVVVWSVHAAGSAFFRDLLNVALARARSESFPIVPVWLDATEKPMFLAVRMGLPMTKDDPDASLAGVRDLDAALAALSGSIRRSLGRESAHSPRRPGPWPGR